jgi:Ca-activated chloride channel family protein
MPGELNFTTQLHKDCYEVMPSPQQAYILFEIMPTAAAPGISQALNFNLVLDRSGSMAGNRLNQMKQAAKLVVDRLGPLDTLSIVIFDETADVVVPSTLVQDKDAMKRQIDRIEERGGTHMSSGMQAGLAELQRGMASGRVSRMMLLTDGQTWEDQSTCEAIADQCRSIGVPLNVLGLGLGGDMSWDPRFLENLAQRSGGEWMIAETPESVITIFGKTVQSMQGTAVTNANMTIRFVENVSPRAVWRVTPLISKLSHTAVSERDVQAFLGDIEHNVGQSLLVDTLLPPRQQGTFRLMHADIRYDVPGLGLTGEQASVDVLVEFTTDAARASSIHPRIMNLVERVTAHKLGTQALDDAAAGNLPNATRKLRAAATRLLELGEEELAQQANNQAQQLEQNGHMDTADAQKMRYATKRLTETN